MFFFIYLILFLRKIHIKKTAGCLLTFPVLNYFCCFIKLKAKGSSKMISYFLQLNSFLIGQLLGMT